MRLKIAGLFLLFSGAAVGASSASAVAYRMASYSISRAPVDSPYSAPVSWAYPVVLPLQVPAHRRLNAWLRTQALVGLKACLPDGLSALPDSKLVSALGVDPHFAACELVQSTIHPEGAFGRYVMFTRRTERHGSVRIYQDVQTMMFDVEKGVAVELQTLFKPEALDELNGMLQEQISEDRERPDCTGRSFEWSQVSLRPPELISIQFPYDTAEWGRCGDGVEVLKGPAVSRLLLQPASSRPVREWVQERP